MDPNSTLIYPKFLPISNHIIIASNKEILDSFFYYKELIENLQTY